MERNTMFEIKEITPELAKEFLAKQRINRPLSKTLVAEYVRRIGRGEWRYNAESIKFNRNGELIDGQHRLNAIIIANKSIISAIARDLDLDVTATLDEGKKRGAADVLSIHQEKHYAILSTLLRTIHIYKINNNRLPIKSSIYISNNEILDLIRDYPEARESAHFASTYKIRFKYMTPSVASFCHWLFSKKSISDTDRFFEYLATGCNLPMGSPILLLRDKFLYHGEKTRMRIDNYAWIMFTIKTWNWFRKGTILKTKVFPSALNETFQLPI